jgi:hypothetical protein
MLKTGPRSEKANLGEGTLNPAGLNELTAASRARGETNDPTVLADLEKLKGLVQYVRTSKGLPPSS